MVWLPSEATLSHRFVTVTGMEQPVNPSTDTVLMISCDTCVARETDACGDCMMSVLCDDSVAAGDTGHRAVVLNLEELREIRLLAGAGLVPTLRHRAVG